MVPINSTSPIRIWPGLAPGETTADSGHPGDTSGNVLRLTGVTSAELFLYGAAQDARKPAVLVCPGGGYSILASDLEGSEIAQWLAQLGFVAAVLHYRVPDKRDGAYQDGRRALSWLRAHAREYGIDPNRVGAMGFSAGAHLVTRLAAGLSERPYEPVDLIDDSGCRLDFALPIYPAYLVDNGTGAPSADVAPSASMPPLFLAQTSDDAHFCSDVYANFAAKAGVDVTSKVYATGGHGYGIRLPATVPASLWKTDAADWLARFLR
ncbi:MAG: alpha/beta hydrolase [Capsulimonadaceae bacterium]|nr:alpha/beta hydrolase [Capsulimonadaceae bacterium]